MIYYTSNTENSIQKLPELSLGGYQSSTKVPNGVQNSLFQDVSNLTIDRNKNEYIGLIIKNETGEDLSNIEIWFEQSINNIAKYKLSAVTVQSSRIENISTRYSKPYNSEFYEADGEENKVSIGGLILNGTVGLWVERSLLIDEIKTQRSKQYLEDNFLNEKEIIESFNLKIEYYSVYGGAIGLDNI